MVLKASHTFNLLDARRAISVTARQQYILRVRALARSVAQSLPAGSTPSWASRWRPRTCVMKYWPSWRLQNECPRFSG